MRNCQVPKYYILNKYSYCTNKRGFNIRKSCHLVWGQVIVHMLIHQKYLKVKVLQKYLHFATNVKSRV